MKQQDPFWACSLRAEQHYTSMNPCNRGKAPKDDVIVSLADGKEKGEDFPTFQTARLRESILATFCLLGKGQSGVLIR
jgi:hypothetical protein